jgi:ribosomal protein S19E (S16A)
MLDKTHALMLRGVAKGIPDGKAPAPALRALIDAGLVEEQSGQHYVVTEQGRRVLELER